VKNMMNASAKILKLSRQIPGMLGCRYDGQLHPGVGSC
jgi:hypothetical protein